MSIDGYVETTNTFSDNYVQLRACILGYYTVDYVQSANTLCGDARHPGGGRPGDLGDVHHRQGRGRGQVPGGRRGKKRRPDGILHAQGCLALTLEGATYFHRSRTTEERDEKSASRFVPTRG